MLLYPVVQANNNNQIKLLSQQFHNIQFTYHLAHKDNLKLWLIHM